MKNKFFDIKKPEGAAVKSAASSVFRSKYVLAHFDKLSHLEEDLKRLPSNEEFMFLQTENQFNAFTFIPAVAKLHTIRHLYAATYSISRRAIEALVELHDKGMIDAITLCISDSLIKRNPKTIDLLTAMISSRGNIKVQFCWSHAKVALMQTDEGHYIVEGSGNWSENAMYEQYLFANSKSVFEFRKELFNNVNVRHVADKSGLRSV
jgi:hypothetical protein